MSMRADGYDQHLPRPTYNPAPQRFRTEPERLDDEAPSAGSSLAKVVGRAVLETGVLSGSFVLGAMMFSVTPLVIPAIFGACFGAVEAITNEALACCGLKGSTFGAIASYALSIIAGLGGTFLAMNLLGFTLTFTAALLTAGMGALGLAAVIAGTIAVVVLYACL